MCSSICIFVKSCNKSLGHRFSLSVLTGLAEFWTVFSMSVAEWWLILGDEPHSEQAARESVSFSPQDSWCQAGSCLNYQVCNAAPVVLFICSWYFQTPLTVKARALCNVLRSSEVWGNERKRKRFDILEQSRFISVAWGGKREEWWLWGTPQSTNLSTAIKSNP